MSEPPVLTVNALFAVNTPELLVKEPRFVAPPETDSPEEKDEARDAVIA